MSLLSLTDLTATRRGRTVLEAVSLTVEPGECIGLIGPNGAGKTTLMRAALGLLPADGQSSLAALPAADRARAAAWMPQVREIAWPVPVESVIALGRLPHLPRGARLHPDDKAVIDAAIARMELEEFRTRTATRLSGGEQARVLIARALAQDTPLLMADEPTAGLDPAAQITAMEVFADLAAQGRSAIVSLHDLGLAARHCTRLILMQAGRIVVDGTPTDVLTPEHMRAVFGIAAHFQTGASGTIFQPLEVIR